MLTIATWTLREALRNRLAWVLLILTLGAVGAAGFVGDLALTESRQIQGALLGASLRLSAAALIAAFVVTSIVRETNDKGQQLLLALDLPRSAYVLGKLAGFCTLAALPALAFGLLALFFAPPTVAMVWAISLLCALGLSNAPAALAASAAFYVLARGIGGLQQTGAAQKGLRSQSQQVMQGGIDLLAALLPRLDGFARSEWLVYHQAGAALLPAILAQTAVYVALLTGAALFDFYRKEL